MSVIINPVITNAGLNVFTPLATGIEFTFTHVAVGTGTSAVNANATALENEIDRFTIAGGGVIAGGKAVSINALVTNHANANPQDYNISEVGFYGLDGNNNTVLFAIHRQSTTIVRKVSGADIALPFVLGLSALPVENMTVTIDTNTSGALALLGQHVANAHPHTQYKRTLDNTEQLKIANGSDNDHAVSKSQLDGAISTEAGTRADADTALQTAINNEATARSNADTALQNQIDALTASIMNKAWPIGSIYENSFDQRNPSHQDLLGFGTWVTLGEGRVTVGYQGGDPDFGTIGQTGGKKGHKMTSLNLLEHNHTYQFTGRTGTQFDVGAESIGSANTPTTANTGNAGQADPEAIPTLPPYIVVIRWVRSA